MVRFYGLTPTQVSELDLRTANTMWLAITNIEAKEMLNGIVVANTVNMKPDDRRRLIRSLEKQAEISKPVEKKEVSNEDVANWIMGALGGGR